MITIIEAKTNKLISQFVAYSLNYMLVTKGSHFLGASPFDYMKWADDEVKDIYIPTRTNVLATLEKLYALAEEGGRYWAFASQDLSENDIESYTRNYPFSIGIEAVPAAIAAVIRDHVEQNDEE